VLKGDHMKYAGGTNFLITVSKPMVSKQYGVKLFTAVVAKPLHLSMLVIIN
jgi:hypothetical protein